MSLRLPARGRSTRLDLDGNSGHHSEITAGSYSGDTALPLEGQEMLTWGEVNHVMRVQKFSRSEQEFLFLPPPWRPLSMNYRLLRGASLDYDCGHI
ncbi:MAG: hypothetical protein WAO35_09800 [Terriglobia bacterium]